MNFVDILEKADCVDFTIHSLSSRIDSNSFQAIEKTLDSLSKDYIWQKSTYTLSLTPNGQIEGELNYGDNIDDEWYIVRLLFDLTKSDKSLIAQIRDADGEFLLMHASKLIPEWLEPENSVNRVFIHLGKLHIVPSDPLHPAQIDRLHDGPMELEESLSLFREGLLDPVDGSIQRCVEKRMRPKPFHHVTCRVPTLIGQLLTSDPRLIARAINSFYYRTPDTLKTCIKMARFSPGELVSKRIKFTRCLYAQLLNQEIAFPRVFPKLPPKYDNTYLGISLGYKIACGFEMDYHLNPKFYDDLISQWKGFENEEFSQPDDSDQWLKSYQNMISQDEMDPKELLSKMKNFLGGESSFDGIDENDMERFEDLGDDMEFGDMKQYIDEMDRELEQEGMEDLEDDQIEMMKNLFESLKSEGGMGGPISSLFGGMKGSMDNEDEED